MKKFMFLMVVLVVAILTSCSKSDDSNESSSTFNQTNKSEQILDWKKLKGKIYGVETFCGINNSCGYHEFDTLKYSIKDENYIMKWKSYHIWNINYHANSDTVLYRYTLNFPKIYIENGTATEYVFSNDTLQFSDSKSKTVFCLLKYEKL